MGAQGSGLTLAPAPTLQNPDSRLKLATTMTYFEMLLHIQGAKETILTDLPNEFITDKHRYLRTNDGWAQDNSDGAPAVIYTRAGTKYVWKLNETPDVKASQ